MGKNFEGGKKRGKRNGEREGKKVNFIRVGGNSNPPMEVPPPLGPRLIHESIFRRKRLDSNNCRMYVHLTSTKYFEDLASKKVRR